MRVLTRSVHKTIGKKKLPNMVAFFNSDSFHDDIKCGFVIVVHLMAINCIYKDIFAIIHNPDTFIISSGQP